MSRAAKRVAMMAVATGVLAFAANAHAYDALTWRSIDGGGVAFVNGGGYRLGATIGQPDAGSLGAGSFTLRGGFWIGGQATPLGVGDSAPPVGPFRFYPSRPNPVRSSGRVAFDLPRASRVALSVFDVSGRVVHRWDYGLLPAGRQERTWNAEDGGGRPLASGVYFLRLDAGREQAVHKVLVVR
jgi:hypothetical protein